MIQELFDELVLTSFVVLITSIVLVIWTLAVRRHVTRAWLRIDHFLPFLRKLKKRETAPPTHWLERISRRILPASWFSDRVTGKPGLIRRVLKAIGPSVVSSPVRRAIQVACFVLFLWLFFQVCWPYDAEPESAGRISSGWRVDQFVGESGNLQLRNSHPDRWQPSAKQIAHMTDEQAADVIRGRMGAFTVVEAERSRVVLAPRQVLTDERLDALLTGTGSWSLHERSPWPSHYADQLAAKEFVPAEFFLVIDPLVSLSTAVASRSWVWSLASAAMILMVCVLIPRGFCGYLCPLGTLIDLFDWSIGKRIQRFRVAGDGWWVHIKYYLLLATLICSLFGILVSGYVAAIPVITRGMLFLGEPLQVGIGRGWSQLPPLNPGQIVSLILFGAVLGLGLFQPRFWCKYVCPSGALFSLGNLLRITERKVESSCIHCNKCVEICPFDAIKPDFTTRVTDCTLCQTCAGVCPTHAIKFVERWNRVELKVTNDPPTHETAIGRRGFISVAAGTTAAIAGSLAMTGLTKTFGANLANRPAIIPVRPPGSVPEREFLEMCIRCGECFKACPFHVLQPLGFQQGLEGLWTPHVVADHSGCAPSCNACGQVCPTGAIRALTLDEKQVARMGLAIVNSTTCLPIAGREACQLCVDECNAAGYYAIEFARMHTQTDSEGNPIEGTGYLVPVVLPDHCVGCGLCQMSCYRVNVRQKGFLSESAIVVQAGEGKEDRLLEGSYVDLRHAESRRRKALRESNLPVGEDDAPLKINGPTSRDTPSAPNSPF